MPLMPNLWTSHVDGTIFYERSFVKVSRLHRSHAFVNYYFYRPFANICYLHVLEMVSFVCREKDLVLGSYERHRELCKELIDQQQGALQAAGVGVPREIEELYQLYVQATEDMVTEREHFLPQLHLPKVSHKCLVQRGTETENLFLTYEFITTTITINGKFLSDVRSIRSHLNEHPFPLFLSMHMRRQS